MRCRIDSARWLLSDLRQYGTFDVVPLVVSGFHVLCYASEGRRWVIVGITVGRIAARRSVTGGQLLWEKATRFGGGAVLGEIKEFREM